MSYGTEVKVLPFKSRHGTCVRSMDATGRGVGQLNPSANLHKVQTKNMSWVRQNAPGRRTRNILLETVLPKHNRLHDLLAGLPYVCHRKGPSLHLCWWVLSAPRQCGPTRGKWVGALNTKGFKTNHQFSGRASFTYEQVAEGYWVGL